MSRPMQRPPTSTVRCYTPQNLPALLPPVQLPVLPPEPESANSVNLGTLLPAPMLLPPSAKEEKLKEGEEEHWTQRLDTGTTSHHCRRSGDHPSRLSWNASKMRSLGGPHTVEQLRTLIYGDRIVTYENMFIPTLPPFVDKGIYAIPRYVYKSTRKERPDRPPATDEELDLDAGRWSDDSS